MASFAFLSRHKEREARKAGSFLNGYTNTAPPALRWGVMGCANIASKNALAILSADGNRLVAVASRSLLKARAWASARGIAQDKAYVGYDLLLADPDVDAVYIPLPTTFHREWVLKAAAAGKHVLCEKPVAPTAREAAECVKACADAGVVWMDGVMFMHHRRLAAMRAVLDDAGRFGAVRHVTSDFSFPGDDAFHANNIRVKADCEPLGCLGDLGWYNIRFSLWAHGWAAPATAQCTYHRAADGDVPVECSGVLAWADGRSATFHCAFTQALTQTAAVIGTKGRLSLNDFVVCKDAERVTFDVQTDAGMVDTARVCVATDRREATDGCCQEAAMFETFAGLAQGGEGGRAFWGRVSVLTQAVVDACVASATAAGGAAVAVEVPAV